MPFRFETFAVTVIVQEDPDGFRTLNDATRVSADGRVEQLAEAAHRDRLPPSARATLSVAACTWTTLKGEALVMETETITGIALHIGGGYGGDSEWSHGQWQGRDFTKSTTYDLTDPDTASKTPGESAITWLWPPVLASAGLASSSTPAWAATTPPASPTTSRSLPEPTRN
ncbi:MAG: hypothetical protein R2709_14555 [Marmoricola sp.]